LKKALVVAMVMVLGLGLFASAQTWEGTWDTDIVIVPAAATFADFISSFDSDLDATFTVGGWAFGMTSDFSQIGLDGLGFTAVGVLGAFSLDVDMDFAPMKLIQVETSYVGLEIDTVNANCLSQTNSWTYESKIVKKTYMPAFDDLTVIGSVSIAGVNFEGLFYLKGTDADHATKYSQYTATAVPTQFSQTASATTPVLSTTLLTVASSTKVGTGAKFTISGSFAGATLTSYTYFNISEKFYNTVMAAYGTTSLENELQKYGTISGLVCEGCYTFFNEEYILLEGLAFGCVSIDAAIDFTCCGFDHVSFLFKDLAFGWGIDFDFLVKFTTSSKTMAFKPEITLDTECISIATELQFATGTKTITGLQIEGLSYTSEAINGLTVSFAATWDYTDNPLIGLYSTVTHYGASKVYFWKPDTHSSLLTTATPHPAVTSAGVGAWALDSAYCYYEKATVFNKLSLDYSADACCGGAFTLSANTYFGTIASYTLTGVYGTYYYDATETTVGAWDVELDFLGAANEWTDGLDADLVANAIDADDEPFFEAATASDDDCALCAAADATAVEYLLIDKDYTVGSISSILSWVESDVDLSIGVASNVTIDFGVDMAWWGWENISLGVTFEF